MADDIDFGALLNELSGKMAAHKEKHGDMRFVANHTEKNEPLTVRSIDLIGGGNAPDVGSFVAVRPAKTQNTYLGIYLGDFIQNAPMVSYSDKSGALHITMVRNPLIYIPDINGTVWGSGSWWRKIESEEDLKQITDQDIENVWYVKAMKALSNA